MSKLLISSVAALCFSAPVAVAMNSVSQRVGALTPSEVKELAALAKPTSEVKELAVAKDAREAEIEHKKPGGLRRADGAGWVIAEIEHKKPGGLQPPGFFIELQPRAALQEAVCCLAPVRRTIGLTLIFVFTLILGFTLYCKFLMKPSPESWKKKLGANWVKGTLGYLAATMIIMYYCWDGGLGKGVEVHAGGETAIGVISSVGVKGNVNVAEVVYGDKSRIIPIAELATPEKTYLSHKSCRAKIKVVRDGEEVHAEEQCNCLFFQAKNTRYLSYRIIWRTFGWSAESMFNKFRTSPCWKTYFKLGVFFVVLVVVCIGASFYRSAISTNVEQEETLGIQIGEIASLYGSLFVSGMVIIGFLFAIEIEKSYDGELPFGGVLLNIFGKSFMLVRMLIPFVAVPKGRRTTLSEAVVAFVAGECPLILGNLAMPAFAGCCGIDFAPRTPADVGRHFWYLVSIDVLKTFVFYLITKYLFNGGFESVDWIRDLKHKINGLSPFGLVFVGLAFHLSLDAAQMGSLNAAKWVTVGVNKWLVGTCCKGSNLKPLDLDETDFNGGYFSCCWIPALVVRMEKWLLCGIIAPTLHNLKESLDVEFLSTADGTAVMPFDDADVSRQERIRSELEKVTERLDNLSKYVAFLEKLAAF